MSARMDSLPIVPWLTLIVHVDEVPPEMRFVAVQFAVQATSVGDPASPDPVSFMPGSSAPSEIALTLSVTPDAEAVIAAPVILAALNVIAPPELALAQNVVE